MIGQFIIAISIFGYLTVVVDADAYLHNPRGSNDRNCERNVNRNNENRLFDRYYSFTTFYLYLIDSDIFFVNCIVKITTMEVMHVNVQLAQLQLKLKVATLPLLTQDKRLLKIKKCTTMLVVHYLLNGQINMVVVVMLKLNAKLLCNMLVKIL